jgi:hypothetical protein
VTPADAMRVAVELELDLDELPICLACLSDVSMAIDGGDERKIQGATARMTPYLWAEGLELPVWGALENARDRGLPGAAQGLAEVAALGPRSRVAKAIVRVLAERLSKRAGGDLLKMGWKPWPPPELERCPPELPVPGASVARLSSSPTDRSPRATSGPN